jgi:hypothetical protein
VGFDREGNSLATDDFEQRVMRLAHDLGLVAPRQRAEQDPSNRTFAWCESAGGKEERLVVVCEDELAAFVGGEVAVGFGELAVVDCVEESERRRSASRGQAALTTHLESVADDADARVGFDRRKVLRLEQYVVLGIRSALPLQPLALKLFLHRFLADKIDVTLRLVLDRREDVGAQVFGCC